MAIPLTERRQIENEMIFRRANESVAKKLDELDSFHIEDGNPHLVRKNDILLFFKCECSDENCGVRIPMQLSKYQKIHTDRDAFVVKHKHQVAAIEKVIDVEAQYNVVEKNNSVPEPGDTLHETTIDNS